MGRLVHAKVHGYLSLSLSLYIFAGPPENNFQFNCLIVEGFTPQDRWGVFQKYKKVSF